MRQTLKDPDLQAEFQRQGFVVVPLLSADEASAYRAEIERLLPQRLEINDAPGELYSTVFDAERRHEAERRVQTILESRLMPLLCDYRMRGNCVMAKVPHTGVMSQHQHNPMSDDMFEPIAHCWCTLDDVDEGSGALRVVPGSHQIVRHIQSFHSPPFFAGFGERMETFAETLPMRAGDAIIFERTLLHGSARNDTERARIRLFSLLLPAESRYCFLVPRGEDRYEAIEPMVDPTTVDPELYCMCGGELPEHRSAGLLPNRNVQLTEAEFAELLRSGAKVAPGFDPIDEIRRRKRGGQMLSTLRRWWGNSKPAAFAGGERIES